MSDVISLGDHSTDVLKALISGLELIFEKKSNPWQHGRNAMRHPAKHVSLYRQIDSDLIAIPFYFSRQTFDRIPNGIRNMTPPIVSYSPVASVGIRNGSRMM